MRVPTFGSSTMTASLDFRLQKIGFVFQDFHLFPRLTTAENVAIPLTLRRLNWDEAVAEALKYLKIVGLENRAQLPPVKSIRRRAAARGDRARDDQPPGRAHIG